MPVRTRIQRAARSTSYVLDGRLSFAERQKRAVIVARRDIAEVDEINRRALGTVPPRITTVDGRPGAPLESVNPDRGIVITEWTLTGDVLQWIYATLRARSPRLHGNYIEGHTLYADGVECDPVNPPPATEYVYLNLVPYSRKIEIGKTKAGRDFVIQVPNRIYERTAQDANARFGNIARIRFTYQAAIGGRIAKRHAKDDRVPAIVVTLK